MSTDPTFIALPTPEQTAAWVLAQVEQGLAAAYSSARFSFVVALVGLLAVIAGSAGRGGTSSNHQRAASNPASTAVTRLKRAS